MTRDQILEYIQSELDTFSSRKYKDKDLAVLYQLGLLQAWLTEAIYADSENFYRFKKFAEKLKKKKL